jgi:hypothetical protein
VGRLPAERSCLTTPSPFRETGDIFNRREKGTAIVLWCNRRVARVGFRDRGSRVEGKKEDRVTRDKSNRRETNGPMIFHSTLYPSTLPSLPLDTRHSVLGNLKPDT